MKQIKYIIACMIGLLLGIATTSFIGKKMIDFTKKKEDKFRGYYKLLNEWMRKKQSGKNISQYFNEMGYKHIAVYGMGEIGKRLLDELLADDELIISYGIDANSTDKYKDIRIVTLEEELEEVDVIVITSVFDFDNIYSKLSKQVKCPIISIEEIIEQI